MPSTATDLSLFLFSVCVGVFGDGGRQEYMSLPTTVAPHIRGRPPGDIGYGMYPAQYVHVCVCGPTRVYVHSLEVHGVACVSACSSLAFLLQHSLKESCQPCLTFLNFVCAFMQSLASLDGILFSAVMVTTSHTM